MVWYQKKSWTTAKKQTYNNYQYDSKFEAGYAVELDLKQKAKEITRWERQVKIPLIVNNFHICNYYIDFIVYYPNGLIEYVECKGYAMEVWKLKWKIFEALYSEKPGVKLTVIQQGRFKLPKAKKIKYANP